MADQRVQELLRELRERYSVQVVERPPEVLIQFLRCCTGLSLPGVPFGMESSQQGAELVHAVSSWLQSFGVVPMDEEEFRAKLANGQRCEITNDTGWRCTRLMFHAGEHRNGRQTWVDGLLPPAMPPVAEQVWGTEEEIREALTGTRRRRRGRARRAPNPPKARRA